MKNKKTNIKMERHSRYIKTAEMPGRKSNMVTVNHNYLKLPGSYLFSTIAKKVKAYKEANPQANVISLGIGDVTQPLLRQSSKHFINP